MINWIQQKLLQGKTKTPLWSAVEACRTHFNGIVAFSAFINLLYLAPSLYMLQVYDRVLTTGGLTTLLFVSLALLLALAALGGLDHIRGRLLARMSARLDIQLSGAVLRTAMALPVGSPKRLQALRDLDMMRGALGGPGMVGLCDLPWTPLYLMICFLLHPVLGLVATAGAVILWLVALWSERSSRQAVQASMVGGQAAYASTEAALMASETVSALGMRPGIVGRELAQRNVINTITGEGALGQAGFASLAKVLRMVLQSLMLGVGAYLAVNQEITAGAIIAASIISARALAPIDSVVGAWRQLAQGAVAYKNLGDLFGSVPADEAGAVALDQPEGRLRLTGIGVALPTGGPGQPPTVLLRDVALEIKPGEVLALIGPSGSGKSTLARVATGVLKPQAGHCELSGVDFTLWDRDALGLKLGYLPQEPSLFAGSLRDNISRFARQGGLVSEEVATTGAIEAAQWAGAHDLIMSLPRGYDTELGPGGRGLSVGQSQRIGLARALYGNPTVLILDEPNAALDREGEEALMQALVKAKERGLGVLLVAHRATVLGVVDTMAVLNNGRIERVGPKAEIIAALNAAAQPQHPNPGGSGRPAPRLAGGGGS
jgi:ATP-binding cassette subfamily C protein